MKTTKNKILALIKQKPGISPKEILAKFRLTRAIVFRHLKSLAKENLILKIGRTPNVKYFYKYSLKDKTELEKQFFNWALTGEARHANKDRLCSTRDIFQARQEKLLFTLRGRVSEDLLYLIVGAVGEIGNNSFDHNLGNWRDTAGLLFAADVARREILLADRGQGVFATIKRVRPKIITDQDALDIAFTKIISGRYPEQRGNGLKFVKKIIQDNNLYLEFYSGNALAKIADGDFTVEKTDKIMPGTLIIIKF